MDTWQPRRNGHVRIRRFRRYLGGKRADVSGVRYKEMMGGVTAPRHPQS